MQEAEAALRAAADRVQLEQARVRYLGKKGELTRLLRGMGRLPPKSGPVIGRAWSTKPGIIWRLFDRSSSAGRLAERALEARLRRETMDVTLPGRGPRRGRLHPVTQVIDEVKRVAAGLGFQVAEGPEVETDYYNFEALNVPPTIRPGTCKTPFTSPMSCCCAPRRPRCRSG